jgi:hypothetical protein
MRVEVEMRIDWRLVTLDEIKVTGQIQVTPRINAIKMLIQGMITRFRGPPGSSVTIIIPM